MVLISGIVIGAIGAGLALWLGKRALTELKARWKLAVNAEASERICERVCSKCMYYRQERADDLGGCDYHGIQIRHRGAQSCIRWRARDDK